MADNCTVCNKVISHTQYNVYDGCCDECYENPYRDITEDKIAKEMKE